MKRRPYRSVRIPLLLGLAAALVVAGCSSNSSPSAPPPPPTGDAAFGSQATSAISGQLVGSGGSATSAAGSMAGVASMAGMQVTIAGTNVSASVDDQGRFLLIGVPSGNVRLHIVGNGNDADLMIQGVAVSQLIQLTIQVAGASAALLAEDRDDLAEFNGMVVAVDSSVTAFTVDDGTELVTDTDTWWDTGGDLFSYAELAEAFADGVPVEAEGRVVPTADGSLLAVVVNAETEEVEEEPSVEELELEIDPDEWNLDWVGSGGPGNGNSAIVAEIEDGPYVDILGSSVEMEGPDGTVVPFATGIDDDQFEARFTRAAAISIVAGVPAGNEVEISVRGTLLDGTPWELSHAVKVEIDDDDNGDGDDGTDEDDGDDDDSDDDNGEDLLDPAVAAQAIIDIDAVITEINVLVNDGELAANNATPLLAKLQAAIGSLQKLHGTPAVNQLEAFLNQLEALEKTDRIGEEAAELLEEIVELIIEALEDD